MYFAYDTQIYLCIPKLYLLLKVPRKREETHPLPLHALFQHFPQVFFSHILIKFVLPSHPKKKTEISKLRNYIYICANWQEASLEQISITNSNSSHRFAIADQMGTKLTSFSGLRFPCSPVQIDKQTYAMYLPTAQTHTLLHPLTHTYIHLYIFPFCVGALKSVHKPILIAYSRR